MSKKWLVGIAAIIAVAALVIGIISFTTSNDTAVAGVDSTHSSDNDTDGNGASATPTDPNASRCGLDTVVDSNDLETTAPPTEWDFVDGFFLTAQDQSNGPGVVEENGVRYCYARTPTGALFAASNYGGMAAILPASEFAEFAFVAGPVRDEKANSDATPATIPFKVEPAGFRLTAYSRDAATVELVASFDGALATMKLELAWSEGDWRVVPLSDGTAGIRGPVLSNLAGYVPWGPR